MAAGRPLIGASGNINHLVSPDLKLAWKGCERSPVTLTPFGPVNEV